MSLLVKLDEIVPAKEAARGLPRVLERLDDPSVEQLVITTRNRPRAVLVNVDRYEALLAAAGPGVVQRRRD